MNKNNSTSNSTFNGRPIMTDEERGLSCSKRILKCIDNQFNEMLDRHNKVFFMRYDVRFPADMAPSRDNLAICAFHSDLMKTLKRQGLDPRYVAAKEQSREKHQHYHGILFLNGNKTQNIEKHLAVAEAIWHRKLGLPEPEGDQDLPEECHKKNRGLIDNCSKRRDGQPQVNGIMLRRDDPEYHEKINQCFYWASYIAKENQKANNSAGYRELFSSRTKKKSKINQGEFDAA